MKALYSVASTVPFARVIGEHRMALVPLGVILAVNLVLLGALVLPLSRSVRANEQRAAAAAGAESAAAAELRRAEALSAGEAQATTDLDTFYQKVLPAGVRAASRITQLRIQQLAREHGVQYRRMSASTVAQRNSSLDRLTVSMMLIGEYEDIRALIYEIETGPEFVVIDNMVLAEGGDRGGALSLSMELSTYYRREAEGSSDGR